MREVDHEKDIRLENYEVDAQDHDYVEQLSRIDENDARKFLDVGVDPVENGRLGTFIQKDRSVIHCKSQQEGIELMGILQAQKTHPWLKDYLWKSISPDTDMFTSYAYQKPQGGFFIHAHAGVKAKETIQTCMYIAKEGFAQNVHNVLIAEENSELHVITGCATAPHLLSGLHVGVSEFYIKKGAKVKFTMIHDWGEEVNVRPRTVTHVEAGGVFVSNYISLKSVGSLQMFPTTYLDGEGSVARFHSILVAGKGSHLDVGSRVVLNAPKTRAEIISRAIVSGGTVIARGDLIGKVRDIKAHLECKGLILKEGLMHAVPELRGYVPDLEMSHEAAVGKIDQKEIEYLMARGLDEDEAISTIVRGFLNVEIEGLPSGLRQRLDEAISNTQKDMM